MWFTYLEYQMTDLTQVSSSQNVTQITIFKILCTKYRSTCWDGEVDWVNFRIENSIICDLFETAKSYGSSNISIDSLTASGFSEEGIRDIYLLYTKHLLPYQHVVNALIQNESVATILEIHRTSDCLS
jgi:hypothetical protein